jgi:hypothetical protein
MFDTFDKNLSGYIDRNELKNIFALLEINISSTNFEKFLQDIDTDGLNEPLWPVVINCFQLLFYSFSKEINRLISKNS